VAVPRESGSGISSKPRNRSATQGKGGDAIGNQNFGFRSHDRGRGFVNPGNRVEIQDSENLVKFLFAKSRLLGEISPRTEFRETMKF
jgi:hypothetical protein